MLHSIDRFDSRRRSDPVRVGDTVRFPLHRLGGDCPLTNPPYGRTWEVIAFPAVRADRHCAIVRRRHDGLTKTVALHWIRHYRLEDRG